MKTPCCGRLRGCVCRRAASVKAGAVNVSSPIHYNSNYATVDGSRVFYKFSKCYQDRCKVKCKQNGMILPGNHIKSHSTGQSFPLLTNSNLNCLSTNIIYLVTCRVCGLQYVGETKRKFAERMREHIDKIRKKDSSQLVYSHFQCDERHRRTQVDKAIRIQIIEKVNVDDLEESQEKLIRKRRRERELFWISKLRTMHPFGLNDGIQGYDYKTNMTSGNAKDYNHYKVENLVKREHKKKNRHLKKKKGGFSEDQFSHFADELTQACRNQIKLVEPLIASKQRKFLERFKGSESFKRLSGGLRFLVGCRVDYLKKIKPVKVKDGYDWKLDLIHKIMDDINLGVLLKHGDLKALLPAEVRNTVICLLFKCGPTIGSKILNYNKTLREAENLTFDEIEQLQCGCADSGKADSVHGHIISGDLNLIENAELRDLLAHGTKFREQPLFNMDQIKDALKGGINSLVAGLARKHKISTIRFAGWKKQLIRMAEEKLELFGHTIDYGRPVLSKRECKNELDSLKSRFVITVVDKAANNFSFTCRKFYFKRLALELGLNNQIPGNDTYHLTNYGEAEICKKLIDEQVRFRVTPEEKSNKIALLYFNPKFHKNPIKMRFIAGNVGTVTSDLDNRVAKVLKMLKKHFFNLCRQTELSSGIRYCFDIENSLDLRECLVSFKGKADSISINDFSTLYTLFEHEHLMKNITWLINRLSKNSGMRFIKINFNSAFWVKDNSIGDSFSIEEILEMIEFLISNSYIKAFGKIFRQVCGIIMGGKISGWLSDLSLMVDEFKYIDGLVKAGNLELARKFKGLCRYRDDCTAINIENFKEIAEGIYPPSLELTQENDDFRAASVLDMNVLVIERQFVTSVYCKTDDFPFDVISLPFLNSNIPRSTCYGVFYSQILRYQRLCTKLIDFENRAKMLAKTLLERGYSPHILKRRFLRVLDKYREEFDKWEIPDNKVGWIHRLLSADST